MNYRDVLAHLTSAPLALHPERLDALHRLILSHRPGDDAEGADLIRALGNNPDELATVRANPRASGAVAVVPLIGFIQQREDIWTRLGFATSTERFTANVQAAANDPNVKAIVLDIDSPGGIVSGVEEASNALFSLRNSKPIVGQSNGMMASAAYYVGSAAGEVISSPSSYTGSIGVWRLVVDESEAWANLGVKLTMIKAGKWKAIGNPYEPLSEDAHARMQGQINEWYEMFVKAVARNRDARADDVRNGYGEGDVLTAAPAKAAGLVDRIATMPETLARFGGVSSTATTARAATFRHRHRQTASR